MLTAIPTPGDKPHGVPITGDSGRVMDKNPLTVAASGFTSKPISRDMLMIACVLASVYLVPIGLEG